MQKTIYSYDRIKIYSFKKIENLMKNLPTDFMKEHCKSFEIQNQYAFSEYTGYKSSIDVIAPNQTFLKMLHEMQEYILPYRISYIEIAKDRIFETENQADQQAFKQIKRTRRKYTTEHKPYDQYKMHTHIEPQKNPNKFGKRTGKDQTKKSGFRQYARNSKVTGEPCLHSEFFFRGPQLITDQTGIKEIKDLIDFDFQLFFESYTKKKLIFDEQIDHEKLGKWILGWTTRRKFTEREIITMKLTAQQFLYYNSIECYADLVHHFQQWKRKIKGLNRKLSQLEIKANSLKKYTNFRT